MAAITDGVRAGEIESRPSESSAEPVESLNSEWQKYTQINVQANAMEGTKGAPPSSRLN